MSNKNNTLEKLQLEMKDTLEGLGMIEVVSASSRNGDIRFLCRIHDEKPWLRILSEFLANEGNWYSFIGKKYFKSNKGGLVFGWVLIFESDELDQAIQSIRRTLLKAYSDSGVGINDAKVDPLDEEAKPGGIIAEGLNYDSMFKGRVRAVK